MRTITATVLLMILAGTAAAWDVSGTNTTKLWSAQPGNAMSLVQSVDLRTWGRLESGLELEGGVRYQLDQEAWDDTAHYRGISSKHARVSGRVTSLTVGNYHATLGRGLVLNCLEEKRTGIDRDLEGADISLDLWDLLDLRLLGGWLRENASMDTARMLAGGQAGIAVTQGLKFSASYVRANAGYRQQAGIFGRPVEEVYGGSARARYGPLEVFAEFDLRRTYGKLVDPTLGWEGADDVKGQAGYVSASFNVPGLGVAIDAKDYLRFNTGFNAPPSANREGWLMNAGQDEQGVQAEATASPWEKLTFTANASYARSRNEYRWAYLPQFPSDSAGRFTWRDYYLEAKWAARRDLAVRAEVRTRSERNLQPDVKVRYYQGGSLEGSLAYGSSRSLSAEIGANRYRNHYIDGDLEYYSTMVVIKWYPLSVVSLFGSGEMASEKVPEYDQQDRWGEAGIELSQGRGRHRIILSAGQTKGGLVCSGGFCRYEPSFRGLRASWEWSF